MFVKNNTTHVSFICNISVMWPQKSIDFEYVSCVNIIYFNESEQVCTEYMWQIIIDIFLIFTFVHHYKLMDVQYFQKLLQ